MATKEQLEKEIAELKKVQATKKGNDEFVRIGGTWNQSKNGKKRVFASLGIKGMSIEERISLSIFDNDFKVKGSKQPDGVITIRKTELPKLAKLAEVMRTTVPGTLDREMDLGIANSPVEN